MADVKFDYGKVNSKTDSIKKSAQENLKNYAQIEYEKLLNGMITSKGDYKTAIEAELSAEKKAVTAAADFMMKLQDLMKQTADAFQKKDMSYSKGGISDGQNTR